MRFSPRQFPHPVLSYFSDDFPEQRFTCALTVEPSADRASYVFDAVFNLTSQTLKSLIQAGSARYALHVHAPASRFRTCQTTDDEAMRFTVGADYLDGDVYVNTLVVARLPLDNYWSPDFHPDYDGYSFVVSPGEILAVAVPSRFQANRVDASRSIFVLQQSALDNPPALAYDPNNERIVISLPEELMRKYRRLQSTNTYIAVLNAMVVAPVLVSLLGLLKRSGESEDSAFETVHDNYRNRRWYGVLEEGLRKIGIRDWIIEDPLRTANDLIGTPFRAALGDLVKQEDDISEMLESSDA